MERIHLLFLLLGGITLSALSVTGCAQVRETQVLPQGNTIVTDAGEAGVPAEKGETEAKVGQDLIRLYEEYQVYLEQVTTGTAQPGTFKSSNPLLNIVDEHVVIDAVAANDTARLQVDLQTLGMQQAMTFGRVVSGQLPIGAIPDLSSVDSLLSAQPAYATPNTGT